MSKKSGFLERLHVPSPCPADWDSMIGNERMRYCSQCDKHVYNLSKMTRSQSEALVARMQGRLCARIERGPDGLVVTEDEQSGLRLISRRASPMASAIVVTMLGISGSALAQTPTQTGEPASVQYTYTIDGISELAQLSDVPASIAGTVTDQAGVVIAGATVTLINPSTGESRSTTSSGEGLFSFASLQANTYAVRVESPGFAINMIHEINLRPNDQVEINVTLQAIEIVTAGGAMVAAPETLRTLYEESDLIVVARVGKSVEVEKEKNGENVLMKTALDVSSFIKDAPRKKRIYVYHWGWGEYRKFPGDSDEGDNLLVFLNRREDGKGYEVSGGPDGAKKLSKHDLGIYTMRIKELAEIIAQESPQSDEIIEWLVRCAEIPATRQEGAFELAYHTTASLEHYGVTACKKEGAGVEVNASVAEVNENSTGGEAEDANQTLSELLTPQQKERLVTALLNTGQVSERDDKLIETVKSWKDERLLPFLVSQLRLVEADPPEFAEELM